MFDHLKTTSVHAHCDAPCGVYDPASARIAAEAVYQITKKMDGLEFPSADANKQSKLAFHNTLSRYITIKEEQAQLTKDEVLILWTDYFKAPHLEQYPEIHELIWNTTKLCSSAKREFSLEHAKELLDNVKRIHEIFWATKEKDVPWILASE